MHRISFIIPYYNSPTTLEKSITSVLGQSIWNYDTCEVVIVDNNSKDTKASEMAAKYPGVRLIKESGQSAAHARNAGASSARFEKLVFIDCDVVLESNWTEMLLNKTQGIAECFAQGEIISDTLVSGRFLDRYRATRLKQGTKGTNHHLLNRLSPLINTAACIINTAFFRKLGGFSTALKRCEDNDFTALVLKAGGHLMAVKGAIARVYYPSGPITYLQRNYSIGMGFTLYRYFWNEAPLKTPFFKANVLKDSLGIQLYSMALYLYYQAGASAGEREFRSKKHLYEKEIQFRDGLQRIVENDFKIFFEGRYYKLMDELRFVLVEKLVRVVNVNTKFFIDLENEMAEFIYRYYQAPTDFNFSPIEIRIIKILISFEIFIESSDDIVHL